ncbi:MAG: beta-N-acetylhexosaminidase [Bacteroidales bacterium]|nr:beta-N-acetylhexosaminidase [Bacteroidales bacterium]
MKPRKLLTIFALLFIVVSAPAQNPVSFKSRFTAEQLAVAPVKLLPYPQKVKWTGHEADIRQLRFETPAPTASVDRLIWMYINENGIKVSSDAPMVIRFLHNTSLPDEGYLLDINSHLISVQASSASGWFYAVQTLRQLTIKDNSSTIIHSCQIEDWPAFKVRGFMLDVGRNFQSMTSLKKQLDYLAFYKMNLFHWHLTDRPAWRIESKIYPELTAAENHRQTRDPGKYYTYDDIREIINYAKNLHIQILPEIDMPGHSDSFVTSMGVAMGSPEGMIILENILNEFFDEIPVEDCPLIHLGSDEVRIPEPEAFIKKMVSICRNHDREVVIWNPGLPADDQVIRQTWQARHLEVKGYKEIDSWNSYTNNGEPMTHITRLFFKPIGYQSENDVIGGIMCLWPDVNLAHEEDAFIFNPHYPSLLAYSWACWTAGIKTPYPGYLTLMPPKETPALALFAAFEGYLLEHKERFFASEPFPYYRQSDKEWLLLGPFDGDQGDTIVIGKKELSLDNLGLNTKTAIGNTLTIRDRHKLGGYFPDALPGQTVYAVTNIHSDLDKDVQVLIGFETPLRANRRYSGIPESGSWDANGGKIWINGKELKGPAWKNPGLKPSSATGWGNRKDQETPWEAEEFYWTRKPATIHLNKGWNRIEVKIPGKTKSQNWMFTFIPLEMNGLKFSK